MASNGLTRHMKVAPNILLYPSSPVSFCVVEQQCSLGIYVCFLPVQQFNCLVFLCLSHVFSLFMLLGGGAKAGSKLMSPNFCFDSAWWKSCIISLFLDTEAEFGAESPVWGCSSPSMCQTRPLLFLVQCTLQLWHICLLSNINLISLNVWLIH